MELSICFTLDVRHLDEVDIPAGTVYLPLRYFKYKRTILTSSSLVLTE